MNISSTEPGHLIWFLLHSSFSLFSFNCTEPLKGWFMFYDIHLLHRLPSKAEILHSLGIRMLKRKLVRERIGVMNISLDREWLDGRIGLKLFFLYWGQNSPRPDTCWAGDVLLSYNPQNIFYKYYQVMSKLLCNESKFRYWNLNINVSLFRDRVYMEVIKIKWDVMAGLQSREMVYL